MIEKETRKPDVSTIRRLYENWNKAYYKKQGKTMISLCITTFERPEMTFKSFEKVIGDDRINEILIIDDYSNWSNFARLKELCNCVPKINIQRNNRNLGCYHNKHKAIEQASNEWVILLDSDNVIDSKHYVGPIFNHTLSKDTIYAPEFARPHFDYTKFTGHTITRGNVKSFSNIDKFDCLINTCNYFFHRETFLSVWKDHPEPWTADTLFMNYNWLDAGNKIYVVGGMQYDHLVHDGSHYKHNVNKTGDFANELMNKLRRL